jgi:hypothetical protein
MKINRHVLIELVLCFSFFINYSNQIFFILDPFEQRCISREMTQKSSFGGVYFISGEKEEGNRAYIKDSNNLIIWENKEQKNGSFNLVVEKEGRLIIYLEYNINRCIFTLYRNYRKCSVDSLI